MDLNIHQRLLLAVQEARGRHGADRLYLLSMYHTHVAALMRTPLGTQCSAAELTASIYQHGLAGTASCMSVYKKHLVHGHETLMVKLCSTARANVLYVGNSHFVPLAMVGLLPYLMHTCILRSPWSLLLLCVSFYSMMQPTSSTQHACYLHGVWGLTFCFSC